MVFVILSEDSSLQFPQAVHLYTPQMGLMSFSCIGIVEQFCIMLQDFIREVLASNTGRDIDYPECEFS
jgi:hypothetical protein